MNRRGSCKFYYVVCNSLLPDTVLCDKVPVCEGMTKSKGVRRKCGLGRGLRTVQRRGAFTGFDQRFQDD